MLLIYPPAARSVEPPLGIARLAGFLKSRGREARCLDLCQEGIDFLLGTESASRDTWTRGALLRRARAADSLRDGSAFRNADRYGRAVGDLNRALLAASAQASGEAEGAPTASLADYRDPRRSPLRRKDLLDSAQDFASNIFYPLMEARLPAALETNADGLVGISICYLSQALCAFAIAGYLKSIRPQIRIILGGGLISSWVAGRAIAPSETFEGLAAAVLPGPGEDGLAEYLGLDTKAPGGPPEFRDFEGLSYFAPTRILPYNFSYGCPWKRCSFCPETAEDQPYRGFPAPASMRDLGSLVAEYRPGLLHITDNEISALYLRALAENPPGARWYGFARFSRLLADPGFCESLAASGCSMLQLGLESGDQGVLDALGKGTRLEEISAALANLAAVSIRTYLYVLFGTPAEDRDSASRTRDFIAERSGEIGYLNVAIFNLPAAGAQARQLETRAFYEGELSLYREFSHPKGWDRAEVRDFLSRDFEAVPEIRGILRRTPPVFTSSHAPFFNPPP